MNINEIKSKIQAEVNKICEANRNKYRRQYPVSKWAQDEIKALGLQEYIDAYPRAIGMNDAQDIINSTRTTVDASGNDDAWSYIGTIGSLLKQLAAAIGADDESDTTFEFSLKDMSSKPFAWMLEGVEISEIGNIETFVEQAARMYINATNYSGQTDAQVYQTWLDETYEFEQAVRYIREQTVGAQVKVTMDCAFELDGVKFRVYRNILWSDGGEFDDLVIRELPEVAEFTNRDQTVQITITASDMREAREHQEYLAEEIE